MPMKRQLRYFTSRKALQLTLALIYIISITFTNSAHNAQAAGEPLKVVGRFLQDANGNNIMMRGVNMPVYKSGWADDLDAVAAAAATTKMNAVRLEWWANPPAGTTQYTVANFDRAIQKYADLGILPIIELHDLTFQYGHDAKTGANSDGNSQTIFANTITHFWTRADILPILIKHQSHLVINLANEWGSATYSDSTSAATNFIQNYTTAITAMRTAGINAPLMVDAPKGFEYQFLLDNGQAIIAADPQNNTMLSIHAYWAANYYTDSAVNTILTNIKNSGLPIILGEVSSNAWTTIQCDPVNYGNMLTSANTNQIGYLFWAWYEDGTCGTAMNMTVNADGVTIPTSASFGYNAINGAGYGIDTALPTTAKISTAGSPTASGSKTLTANRAIARWPAVPADEKRPVLVFLPGWDGTGAVNAAVSSQNVNLVNEGYVTLAIGFDSSATWYSDIAEKTKAGLDKLCADTSIPADCGAIALVGSSYGAAQNYWVIEHLRGNGYDGGIGSSGNALAFLSEDGGYGAPGTMNDPNTGAYTRTGLADTSAYSVAMIENLGDSTFPVDECTWGNCGARELSNAHLTNGDDNVFSICPPGGEHGTRGFSQWNEWVISAIKTMLHTTQGVATFTGYSAPTLDVSNACISIVPPVVTDITRADADPSNAASVRFTINFSKQVSGVDLSDFNLATDIVNASKASISPVGPADVYTVTVNTGTGSGILRLDLADNNSIVSADSIPLGGAGANDGDFSSGETYIIDRTPPTVYSSRINSETGATVNFKVTFSEIVEGVDVSDFSTSITGNVTGEHISKVSGAGATRIVTVYIGSGDGTLRLDVEDNNSILDAALNPLNGNFTGGESLVKYALPALNSDPLKDGWVLESKEFSNIANTKMSAGNLRVGDDAKNRQYRSLLYFDTAGLPNNAVISKAVVIIKKNTTPPAIGDVEPLGNLVADMKKGSFGVAALENGDFSALAAPINTAGKFTQPTPPDDWYTLTISPVNFKYINLTGATQFRVRFTKDDNNDKDADYITFYGDGSGADAPQFIVEYYIP